jgi:hypothetical protein
VLVWHRISETLRGARVPVAVINDLRPVFALEGHPARRLSDFPAAA